MARGGWRVELYRTATGEVPVRAFVDGLEPRPRDEADALVRLLREQGNQLRRPHSALIAEGVFELRGHQVRIAYVFRPGRRAVLLDGTMKKQDKLPREFVRRVVAMARALEAAEGGE